MHASVSTRPTPPVIVLERVRWWLFATSVGALVAISEWLGTRLGRDPVDPLRMTAVFLLVAGAALVYGLYVRRRFDEGAEQLRAHFEKDLTSSKDAFIANVSHGLRTPLTGVVGFAHLLDEADLTPEERESLDLIVAESAELSRMVDDLVTSAQLDADAVTIAVEPVSMLDEVEKVIDFMDMVGAEVGIDIQDVDVMVDPSHFSQILRNLLTNAHRHGKPAITVRGAVANGKYICHVIDQGPGVATEDQSRLFTRFSSSVFGSQFSGAVGLGLAVVSELTARMGCDISYRRIRGETQFVLSMPLAEHQSREMRRIVRAPSARRDAEASAHLQAVPA